MHQVEHGSPRFLPPLVMGFNFLRTTTWCITKNVIQPDSQAPEVVKNPVLVHSCLCSGSIWVLSTASNEPEDFC